MSAHPDLVEDGDAIVERIRRGKYAGMYWGSCLGYLFPRRATEAEVWEDIRVWLGDRRVPCWFLDPGVDPTGDYFARPFPLPADPS